MISRLRVQRFKSWRDTGDVRLAPLTALFGTNSSGKTSLLQVLLMLKQTADSPDRNQVLNLGDDRALIELGTFPEVLFEHDRAASLEWELDWSLEETLRVIDPASPGKTLLVDDRLGFSASVGWRENGRAGAGPTVERMTYRFATGVFGMEAGNQKPGEYELVGEHAGFGFRRAQGRPRPLPSPVKCYGFPDQVRAYYQNAGFLSDLELAFEQMCDGVHYLGPLREYPKRQYLWAGARPIDMGRRGERVVDALLASRADGATISRGRGRGHSRQTVEERVAECLKQLGLIDRFEVRAIAGSQLFQVWVRRQGAAEDVLLTDVGFGVSQILPVIALCYYAPVGSTLLLEQPEIHLHPSVQAGLADVFVDAIKTRKVQIVLESHSEHLLRRLQRRVAEEKLPAADAALYFCALDRGESQLTTLDLDEYGTIRNWPPDFFGDEFGEIAATSRAALKRQQNAATS